MNWKMTVLCAWRSKESQRYFFYYQHWKSSFQFRQMNCNNERLCEWAPMHSHTWWIFAYVWNISSYFAALKNLILSKIKQITIVCHKISFALSYRTENTGMTALSRFFWICTLTMLIPYVYHIYLSDLKAAVMTFFVAKAKKIPFGAVEKLVILF